MRYLLLLTLATGCWSSQVALVPTTDSDADTDTDADTGADTDSNSETETIHDSHYLWHAFYDDVSAITVDSSGNTYHVGSSYTSWTGPGGESPVHPHSGDGFNAFVHKMTSDGGYLWHTFLGPCAAGGVAVDDGGGVVVSGTTPSSWDGPGGEEPINDYLEIMCNFFILKLDADGAYQWHTFQAYGDYCYTSSISVDGSGNIDITVPTSSAGMMDPMTFSNTLCVMQFDTNGTIVWGKNFSSAFGGRLTLDASGNLYVTGSSYSEVYAPDYEEPLQEYTSGENSLILKLDASGAYQWHTFYPTGTHTSPSISLDGSGGVFLAGPSGPDWTGPSEEEPLRPADPDVSNLYVLKLDDSGVYQWHTFWGLGCPHSNPVSIAVNGSGAPCVTGSSSDWQGPEGEDPDTAYIGGFDIMALALGANGSYGWHGFYGANCQDHGYSIVADGFGALYLTGTSDSSWSGPNGESPLHAVSEQQDPIYFILKLAE